MKNSFLLLVLFFLSVGLPAQNFFIEGHITNAETNAPLPGVTVVGKDSLTKKIVGYTISLANGTFLLNAQQAGWINITASYVGFQSKTRSVELIANSNDTIAINFALTNKASLLDEVFVKSQRPISINGDTITLKTSFFTNGNERTLEDLLEKLPGITVDAQGTVKVGNKVIEKLMIEGDDFFGKQYKILSKNMPAYPIEKVEIINRYNENRLLKGIENSDKVALNIKLGNNYKNIWFGHVDAGYGNEKYHWLKGDLMSFGKRNKYMAFSNINNIGVNTISDFNYIFGQGQDEGRPGDIRNVNTPSLLNFSNTLAAVDEERANRNQFKLGSINTILNPSEKVKIKLLGFINTENARFTKTIIDSVTTSLAPFTTVETDKLQKKNISGLGSAELVYNISEKQELILTSGYVNTNTNDHSLTTFNNDEFNERLKTTDLGYNQTLQYTYKLSPQTVLLLSGKFIRENKTQRYGATRFAFYYLFPDSDSIRNVQQDVNSTLSFVSSNATVLHRVAKFGVMELQLGNELQNEGLKSSFAPVSNAANVVDIGDRYHNNSNYKVNDLFFIGKYRHQLVKDFSLVPRLELHKFANEFKGIGHYSASEPFIVNFGLSANWKINDNNNIVATYSRNKKNAEIKDIYNGYILTGFRSLTRGSGELKMLESSSAFFSYQLGNWLDRFFVNASFLYVKNYDFFSTSTAISPNYIETNKILVKDREWLNVNFKTDYYMKQLSTNIKLNLGYSKSDYKNIVNSSPVRNVSNQSYQYGVELKSGFRDFFNYNLGTKWANNITRTVDNSSSFNNNVTFLDLLFDLRLPVNFSVKTERYFFQNTENSYFFTDAEFNYKLKKDHFIIGFTLNNLFNVRTFEEYSISDLGITTTQYELLPRIFMLRAEFRF